MKSRDAKLHAGALAALPHPTLEQIMSGLAEPNGGELRRGAELGLYSITLNNDLAFDVATLEAYKDFRLEAERKGFRSRTPAGTARGRRGSGARSTTASTS